MCRGGSRKTRGKHWVSRQRSGVQGLATGKRRGRRVGQSPLGSGVRLSGGSSNCLAAAARKIRGRKRSLARIIEPEQEVLTRGSDNSGRTVAGLRFRNNDSRAPLTGSSRPSA